MKAITLTKPGPPENLQLSTISKLTSTSNKEVLIKVKAFALNRADLLQRKGQYPAPPGASETLGLEIAGEVVHDKEVGETSSKWADGASVMALLPGGGYAEYCLVHEDHVLPIPKGLNFQQAAAIPEVWLTSFQILHTIANFQSGEFVLIHAGASGIGTASIQLCHAIGAKPIVTVGSEEKSQYLKEKLKPFAIINYKTEDFSAKVKELTGGQGVNIIMDPVGASNFQKNLDSISRGGRWVLFGTMGGTQVEKFDLRSILGKGITLVGTTLRARPIPYKSKLVSDFGAYALQKFEEGSFQPIIHKVLNVEDIVEAHKIMEENLNIGKIVIEF